MSETATPASGPIPQTAHTAITRRALVRLSLRGVCGLAAISLAGACGPLLAGCAAGGDRKDAGDADATAPATSSTFAFDTYCTFTAYGDDAAPALLAKACARYDALFDLYDPASDIARVNAAGGAPVAVDPETADAVEAALALSEELDGLFDITIGAVSTLWDFHEGVRPDDDAIAQALPHVDWRRVVVDRTDAEAPTIALGDASAKLDLGAIAKGFIADRLCRLVEDEADARAVALSLGGNIAYVGEKPDGGLWMTGIRDPNDPGGSRIIGTAQTRAGSLVTSGLYERTFDEGDVTYWHILDPATGMPVATDVVSVTVWCPSSTRADALSTALFVAGSARGVAIVDGLDDTAAYFVLADGSRVESRRWRELTRFEESAESSA